MSEQYRERLLSYNDPMGRTGLYRPLAERAVIKDYTPQLFTTK
jgi:hypothetical protein